MLGEISTSFPQRLVDGLCGAALVIDSDQRVLCSNQALLDLLSLPASPVGAHCHDFVHACGPEGLPLCGVGCELHRQASKEQTPTTTLMWCRVNGGSSLLVRAQLQPLASNGSKGLCLYLFQPVDAKGELKRVVGELSGLHRELVPGVGVEARVTDTPPSSPFTKREADVLRQVKDGCSTSRIAEKLGISSATVRNHVQNAISKVGAHTRLEAVLLGIRNGWLD